MGDNRAAPLEQSLATREARIFAALHGSPGLPENRKADGRVAGALFQAT